MSLCPHRPCRLAPLALVLALCVFACGAGAGSLPPGIPADDPLVAKGFLPVTRFGAVPDDGKDDTAALQKAVDAAREHGLVAFFPSGEYLLSDTLQAVQRVVMDKQRWRQDRRQANALVGSAQGRRPVLRLADGAPGFDDPGRPKPLVWIWAQARSGDQAGSRAPRDEQPNISFNQVFKGIDIDLRARGNRGAAGIRHAGSQGSSIEEVSIRAEGAFAGLYNLPGQGGGVYDLSVTGGRFGVWANHQSRYPVMAGVRLLNQDTAAIFWNGQSNLTVAGFVIEGAGNGPMLTLQPGRQAHNRALTLVDGVVRGKGALAIDNEAGRSLYLHNVYAAGFTDIVRSGRTAPVKAPAPLARVAEYAFTGTGSRSLIDGRREDSGYQLASVEKAASLPAADTLVARHLWPDGGADVEDADAVSIVRYGAQPDDDKDDSAAIRKALASHDKVFVPVGTFLVSETLRLGPRTQLFGAAKHLSVIRAAENWRATPGTPIIAAADGADAVTRLSFLMIERSSATPGLSLLEWRAGRGSVVRDLMGGQYGPQTDALAAAGSTFRIVGNGGGRWYGLAAEWNRLSPGSKGAGYRHLLVEATREPLALYGLNIERGLSDPQAEIVDARNVTIYSLKGESLKTDGATAVLQVRNSRNVSIFGYSGNAAPRSNAVLRVVDSDDYVLANVMPVNPGAEFETVRTRHGEASAAVSGDFPVSIVRRGNPAPMVW